MRIVDLSEPYHDTYFVCLEDWSDEMKEARDHKKRWYERMKDQGLRAKLAVVDDKVCGMMQYLPAENSFVDGRDLYFITCIWVHGYKQGVGNWQKKGLGKALLQAAEEDARAQGARGIAAWGVALPFWMKASWFKKREFIKVDFRAVNTVERDVQSEWGIVDGLFIDDKQVRTGPPPKYEKIHRLIARRVKKLK